MITLRRTSLETRLTVVAGGTLFVLFFIMVAQKYAQYGGSPEYDFWLSAVYNLVTLVPFAAVIHAGVLLDRVFRRRYASEVMRIGMALFVAGALIASYMLVINGVLFSVGLSTSWPSAPFLGKYTSGILFVHAGIYAFVLAVLHVVGGSGLRGDAGSQSPVEAQHFLGIPVSEIRRLDADDHYVRIYHTQGEVLERMTMQYAHRALPERFVRVHRSHIVNLDHVDGLDRHGKVRCVCMGEARIRVSESGWRRIRDKIG